MLAQCGDANEGLISGGVEEEAGEVMATFSCANFNRV